jgi:hypothetical protein
MGRNKHCNTIHHHCSAYTTPQATVKIPSPPSKWIFSIDKVALKNIRFHYDDEYAGVNIAVMLDNLKITVEEIDFGNSIYDVDELLIDRLNGNVLITKTTEADNAGAAGVLPKISANKIRINASAIEYQVKSEPETTSAFDVNHLDYSHLTINAVNFLFFQDTIKFQVKKFSAIDRNNFSITRFETEFRMAMCSISIRN